MSPGSDSLSATQLVIVRRNQFATFAMLAQAFADEPNVRLVWDRRVHQRRRESTSSDPTDRRQRDRRRDRSLSWGNNDYVLLNTASSVEPRAAHSHVTATDSPAVGAGWTDFSDQVARDIEVAVKSDLAVLISGGEILSRTSLAHRIHRYGNRAACPLTVVNRETFVEVFTSSGALRHVDRSNGGTLLIEEVADLSWEQQSELVHLLERRAVEGHARTNGARDARIISATGHWLLDRIASKQFRADLFYRLNVIHLVLPMGALRAVE